tara:strand:- start:574 stop:927 length:354 start_codon:yes stop_codon:yes gene_type:complete
MELVALLSSGENTWSQVSGLIKEGEWDKVIVLGNDEAKSFSVEGKNFEFIQIDLSKRLVDLKKEMLEKIKGKIDGLEVALTIASGNGKEHMALCSALLSIPTGIRFTALTRDGIIYL